MTGRRTKLAELSEFAEANGLDPQLVKDFIGTAIPKKPPPYTPDELGDPPERFEDWLPEMRRILWTKLHSFDGVAAVQVQKLLKELVTLEREEGQPDLEAQERRPLLERLDALPPEHAIPLLQQEIARTDAYYADLLVALEQLEAK